jgi:flagellin
MSSVIYTNMASQVAQKNLLGAQNALATSVERLSSGLRINRARDDAAGLSVANSLSSQINGANQGIRNLNDAISMVQTAEGAISAASDMGQRILTLATQAANSTLSTKAREAINNEMSELINSIDSIGRRTAYAGNPLLNQSSSANNPNHFTMQISNDSADQIELNAAAFRSIGLNSTGYVTVGTNAEAVEDYVGDVGETKTAYLLTGTNTYSAVSVKRQEASVYLVNEVPFTVDQSNAASKLYMVDPTTENGQAVNLKAAIELAEAATNSTAASLYADVQEMASSYVVALDEQRSLLGAYQNRLEYTLSNITELSTNLTASRSRVIDTDYASETANLTRNQILQQAATAMLAQANQMPNVILTLLK